LEEMGLLMKLLIVFLNLVLNILPTSEKLYYLILIFPQAEFCIIPGGKRNILAKSLNIQTDPMLIA